MTTFAISTPLRMRRFLVLCITIQIACFASTSFATPFKFSFDESNSLLYNLYDNNGVQAVVGKFITCADGAPCDGIQFRRGSMGAWSYALPVAAKAVDGDVLIDGSAKDPDRYDLLRFRKNVLYVFSTSSELKQEAPGVPLDKADVFVVPTTRREGLAQNSVFKDEDIKDDANSGLVYKPAKDEPGSGPKPTQYCFQSDGNGGADCVKFVEDISSTDPAKSKGNSVSYDALHQRLSFTNDFITDTTFADDSLLNALVNVPSFSLIGLQGDGTALFQADPNALFALVNGSEVFMQAHLSALTYNPVVNTFSGALTGLSFDPSSDSPWIGEATDVYNPQSADFDPGRILTFTYTPNSDFLALTSSFTADAESSGTNSIDSVLVPEPATLILVATGLIVVARRERRARGLARSSGPVDR